MPEWLIVSFVTSGIGIVCLGVGGLIVKYPPSDLGVPDEIQKEIDRYSPAKYMAARGAIGAFVMGILALVFSIFNLLAHLINS